MIDEAEDAHPETGEREQTARSQAAESGMWRDYVLAGYWVEVLHDELIPGGDR